MAFASARSESKDSMLAASSAGPPLGPGRKVSRRKARMTKLPTRQLGSPRYAGRRAPTADAPLEGRAMLTVLRELLAKGREPLPSRRELVIA